MTISQDLFQRALRVIPGGVNSPVRSFNGVGGSPIFFERAKGSHMWDVDGNCYIDYVGSWGPLILGHCDESVIEAITSVSHTGVGYGAPVELEIKLAEKIIECVPSVEKIRMVNSGTEATMTAIRLARGVTKRSKIIKFNGCYHGHSDSLLVKAGSGALTLGIPSSPGVPDSITQHTLTADFNDIEQTRLIFETYPDEVAAIIVEPIAGNMGFVLPDDNFLSSLRALCDKYGALLIFDEVMTGFRVALGGAQELYNIKPDITTFGKVIGGGLPVGAIGGRVEIMDHLAPIGAVYQAGTLSGNPLAMAAGLATLDKLQQPNFYQQLIEKTEYLVTGMNTVAKQQGVSFSAQSRGGMFGFCFADKNPRNYQDVANSNSKLFKDFFHGMLKEGVYFAPSQYEAGFVSSTHSIEDINNTCASMARVLDKVKSI